jgi:Ca2+-binding EF-hand superfamily protein
VPMQPAAREQPATGGQVAQVVDTEFPTYDKNGDGKLSATEFGGWMVALKSKTDPSTKPDAPETKKWVSAAFAQADTDKSKSLTKTEVTSFLSQG